MKKNKKFFKSRKNNKKKDYISNTLSIDDEYIKRKEKITSFFLNPNYVPMTRKEISSILGIPKQDRGILVNILNELIDNRIIYLNENARFCLVKDEGSYICKFECKNENYGFACIQDSTEDDFYVPRENFLDALNGDIVVVVIDNSRKYKGMHKKVGRIIKVEKRCITKVVGEVYSVKKKTFVRPIDDKIPSILINKILCDGIIQNGMMVQTTITMYPNRKRNFEGNIEKVVCTCDETNAYVKALYASYMLDEKEKFKEEILKELDFIEDEVSQKQLMSREDRTKDNVYTIDSEDAKDLDDAICIKLKENGNYILSVHIADVSNYVRDGSLVDEEALRRATSIYVPGSVIPMLPKKLSNGICSLNEGKIRLTLSIDMEIDKLSGDVVNSRIYKGYIKSKKKMTYEKVYKCITKSDDKVLEEYKDYLDDIKVMLDLSKILNDKRQRLGSINFDIPETKIELNEDGTLKDIHPYDKNVANNIIEEFMLVANMTIAETFYNFGVPFIYRVHEKPDEEKLRNLNDVLSMYNKRIKSIKSVTPKVIQEIVTDFKTEEEKKVISTFVLRALKLAKYDPECLGHFGLAFKYYCHFTSPIRRYPDLFIHRVISDYIEGKYTLSDKKIEKYTKQAISYSIISSEMEKEATKIEREFDDMYKAIFMKDKISQEFSGIVSSVTSFGMFVMLPSTIEGLVHISNMKGYYTFDEKKCMLVDKSGKSYKIGDKVKVKVIKSDVRLKQIDFVLA